MVIEHKLKVTRESEVSTISSGGSLDLTVSKEFRTAIEDEITSGKGVVVDLRATQFIDSAILTVLAEAGLLMLSRSGRLKVWVEAGSHPDYVLKMVGFDQVLEIEASPTPE